MGETAEGLRERLGFHEQRVKELRDALEKAVMQERQEREARLLASAPPDHVIDAAVAIGGRLSGGIISPKRQDDPIWDKEVPVARRAMFAHVAQWAREELLRSGMRVRATDKGFAAPVGPVSGPENATLIFDEAR